MELEHFGQELLELEERLAQGAKGVKIHPGLSRFYPADEKMFPLYERLSALGVPILVAPGTRAIFGPVVLPPPMGADALELWDITVRSAKFPGLYEMKRPKTSGDLQHIAEVFNPYLRGREWETIQKPAL